jgi:hypothetical protein
MLTTDDFKKRASQLFNDSRTRWRKRLEKSAGKDIKLEIAPSDVLPFTLREFEQWLWPQVKLQAVPCPYCRALMDILSLSLDHKIPLRRGGGPGLDNLQIMCQRCNRCKGQFTHDEFLVLVIFMEGPGAHFRQRLEGFLILGNMNRRFPGQKEKGPAKPRKTQNALEFGELGPF